MSNVCWNTARLKASPVKMRPCHWESSIRINLSRPLPAWALGSDDQKSITGLKIENTNSGARPADLFNPRRLKPMKPCGMLMAVESLGVMNPRQQKSFSILLAIFAGAWHLAAQNTSFTYAGRLDANGTPANGFYDFQFRLDGDPKGDSILGTFFTNAVPVTNGLFTLALDFEPAG